MLIRQKLALGFRQICPRQQPLKSPENTVKIQNLCPYFLSISKKMTTFVGFFAAIMAVFVQTLNTLITMNGIDLNDSQNQNFGNAEATPDVSTPNAAQSTEQSQSPNAAGTEAVENSNAPSTTAANVEPTEATEVQQEANLPKIDYNTLSKFEMVEALKRLIDNYKAEQIHSEVETIKRAFYAKHTRDLEVQRQAFVEEEGGLPDEFVPEKDANELKLKELLRTHRTAWAQHTQELDAQKQKNLELKQQIIEQIKALVDSTDTAKYRTFQDLQQQWREIGPVPQTNIKELWDNYHHHVQNFYDQLKIERELRDLDLKRNLEAKTELCEKAEELMALEPSSIEAFNKLQKFHEQWREIGPVPNEHRTPIWERFQNASKVINKRHQEYFDQQREEQKRNKEAKIALCEKAEEVAAKDMTTIKEMQDQTNEMLALQQVWKTIGVVPRKDNTALYERFRTACDKFFEKKRAHRSAEKEEQSNNLQLKTELCIQAEALKTSTEWKKATDEFIALQKRWREIGPVPRKHSEKLWQRFRAACDEFFKAKNEQNAANNINYAANLRAKEELVAEIEAYTHPENTEEAIAAIHEFQRRWTEIGFVPMKQKETIQTKYKNAITKHFEELNIAENEREMIRLKTKIEEAQNNPRKSNNIRIERDKLYNKMRQLESDITTWENNIGFFAKSKNADAMIQEVQRKIAKAKEDIALIVEKIKLIDNPEKEA